MSKKYELILSFRNEKGEIPRKEIVKKRIQDFLDKRNSFISLPYYVWVGEVQANNWEEAVYKSLDFSLELGKKVELSHLFQQYMKLTVSNGRIVGGEQIELTLDNPEPMGYRFREDVIACALLKQPLFRQLAEKLFHLQNISLSQYEIIQLCDYTVDSIDDLAIVIGKMDDGIGSTTLFFTDFEFVDLVCSYINKNIDNFIDYVCRNNLQFKDSNDSKLDLSIYLIRMMNLYCLNKMAE